MIERWQVFKFAYNRFISVIGKGSKEPIGTNAQNRRVEIVLGN